jgi:hypothetical protein
VHVQPGRMEKAAEVEQIMEEIAHEFDHVFRFFCRGLRGFRGLGNRIRKS